VDVNHARDKVTIDHPLLKGAGPAFVAGPSSLYKLMTHFDI
jgi:hypothetical protein